MNFLDLAKKRQSTRKYSSKPIPREIIDKCIEAGRIAPSACNSQPWFFVILDDEKTKNQFAENIFSGIYSMNSFAKNAPVLIAVITEKSTCAARLGGYFKGTQYNLIDIGIVCEHIVLQAAEEGIGTCWIGWFNEKYAKKSLQLPSSKKIDIIISMGYPAEETRVKSRKDLEAIRKYH